MWSNLAQVFTKDIKEFAQVVSGDAQQLLHDAGWGAATASAASATHHAIDGTGEKSEATSASAKNVMTSYAGDEDYAPEAGIFSIPPNELLAFQDADDTYTTDLSLEERKLLDKHLSPFSAYRALGGADISEKFSSDCSVGDAPREPLVQSPGDAVTTVAEHRRLLIQRSSTLRRKYIDLVEDSTEITAELFFYRYFLRLYLLRIQQQNSCRPASDPAPKSGSKRDIPGDVTEGSSRESRCGEAKALQQGGLVDQYEAIVSQLQQRIRVLMTENESLKAQLQAKDKDPVHHGESSGPSPPPQYTTTGASSHKVVLEDDDWDTLGT